MANFNFSLGFDVEKDGLNKAKQEIDKLKREISNDPAKFNLNVGNMQEVLKQINIFEKSLKSAFNQDMGKLNTKEFMKNLHAAGYSLEGLKTSFDKMGVDGSASLGKINASLNSTGLSLKKTNKLVEGMVDTFANTLKWNIASQAIHGIEGSIGRAIGFVKDLDESLNNIRVVTGKSKGEMESFAKSANEAAKALGKTTVEYTDASLLYFQQGKSASEVRKLTEATLMASSITGESVSEVSELLTASLNGYSLAADKALEITDKFAAVGATTGSDFNEIAIGFSKVASMADIAGVSVDQLNAILATTSTVTREAPESIGTSYKTIFGRMTDLKAGKEDEDGWNMGQVEGALNVGGFSMVDKETNTLREVGAVIEEIGGKWETLNKETQLGISIAMAGSRQQNRLLALFNNWEMYKSALEDSQEAEGTTYDQNLIRMDSLEYKAKQLRAAMEEMWMKIIDSDAMKGMIDGLTSLTEMANTFVDAIGGILPMLATAAGIVARLMSNKISQGAVEFFNNNLLKKGIKEQDAKLYQNENKPKGDSSKLSAEEELRIKRLKEEYQIRLHLSQEEQKAYKAAKKSVEIQENKVKSMKEELVKHQAMVAEGGKWGSTEKRDLTLMDNEATIRANANAIKQVQALKDEKIALKDISKETLVTLNLEREKLGLLAKQESKLDEILITRHQSNEELKEENALIRANQKTVSEENVKKVAQADSNLQAANDTDLEMMNGLARKAAQTAKLQSAINIAAAVTTGVTVASSAMAAFIEAGNDVEKKADAVAVGITGIGSALMMTGNPYLMAAGAGLNLVSVLGKLFYENTGFNKTLKDNKKFLEEVAERISIAKNKLGELSDASVSYNELLAFMKNGEVSFGDLNTEQLEEYFNLSNAIAEKAPELVKYYDEEGNAVLDLTKNINDLRDAQKEQIRVENEGKNARIGKFAEESSRNIETAKKTLDEAQSKLDVINQGQDAVNKFNADHRITDEASGQMTQTEYINMDEADGLIVKVQEQQAILQQESEKIKNNIMDPIFSSSKAYSLLTDEQQEMVRGMLTLEQATKMVHDPKKIQAYANEMEKLMATMSDEKTVSEDIAKNEKEIAALEAEGGREGEIKVLAEENKLLQEKGILLSGLTKSIENLSSTQLSSMTETMSLVKLEGEEYDKALAKMTEYYSSGKALRNGPMSTGTLEELTGVEVVGGPDLSGNSESRLADLAAETEAYKELKEEVRGDLGESVSGLAEDIVSGSPGDSIEHLKGIAEYAGIYSNVLKEKRDVMIENSLAAAEAGSIETQLNEQYWDQVETLAQTTEGYNELAEAYNSNLEVLGYMSKATGENSDLTVDEMDKVAESLEAYRDTYPGLSDALDEYSKNGEGSFSGLAGYVDEASSQMEQRQGRMYASMKQDDTEYYQELLGKNKNSFQRIWELYGINAYNYKTYAEYEEALETAKQNGKISKTEQAANAAIDIHEQQVAADKGLLEEGLVNDIAAGNKTVSIWSIVSNQQISGAEKAVLVIKKLWDGFTGFFAQVGNGIVGIWNGVIETIEGSAQGLLKEVNWVLEKVGKKTIEVDFSFAKINKVFTGTTSAADYAAGLADKYNEEQIDMDWNLGDGPIAPKVGASPVSGGNKNGDTGNDITPGGGSGSDGGSAKEQEDMEEKLDFLHDTNVLLQKQEDLLKKLKDEEKNLYGKAKIDNLDKQNVALERKKSLLQEQLKLIAQQETLLKNSLSSQGTKFNADGSIANYNQIIQAKVNSANAIGDADSKKAAQDAVKDFIKDLEEYENFNLKVKVDKQESIRSIEDLQREIYLEKFEFVMKVKLELAEDQEDLLAFLKEVNDKFENISDTFGNTQKELNLQLSKIEETQKHIDKIVKDTTLTEKERIELMEEYNKELMDTTKSATKLREELTKISEEAIKDGVDLLGKQLDKYEHIGSELDHILNVLKLTGDADNYAAIDDIFEVQGKILKAQLDAQIKVKESLKSYVSQLKEGSEEWEAANSQLEKIEGQINKITEQTLKIFQEEFKNSFTGIMDELDKQLSGGTGLSNLKDEFKKLQKEQAKYLSLQEKIIWAGDMQQKIQDQINTSSNPKEKSQLQAFLDSELKTLKEKDKLTENDTKRAEMLYDLTLKQIAIDELRNNKSIQRLVRDSHGNWSYQYVEDTKKVAEAQYDLSDKLKELMEFDSKALQDQQNEMLELKIDYHNKIKDIVNDALNGEYETQEAFNQALKDAEIEFNEEIMSLELEYGDLTKNITESTMAAVLESYATNRDGLGILTAEQEALLTSLGAKIGTDWTQISILLDTLNQENSTSFKEKFADIVGADGDALFLALKSDYNAISSEWSNSVISMITSNSNLTQNVSNATNNIKQKWGEYQTKVSEVREATNTEVSDMTKKVDALDKSVGSLNKTTGTIIETIKKEWSAVGDLVTAYQGLKTEYDSLISKTNSYIEKLNEQIKKQKEAATGVTTPGTSNPSTGSSGSGGTTKPSTGTGSGSGSTTPKPTTPAPTTPGQGSKIRVKPGKTWYYDSAGMNPSGKTDPYSNRDLYVVNTSNNKYKYAVGGQKGNIASALGWLNLADMQGFRTGGYTGEWGNDGKVAMLHEKEMVLNKEDTKNILDVVRIVRDYASLLKNNFGNALSVITGSTETSQNVIINADFSGVKSSFEIEKAFENIENRASQYALKRK